MFKNKCILSFVFVCLCSLFICKKVLDTIKPKCDAMLILIPVSIYTLQMCNLLPVKFTDSLCRADCKADTEAPYCDWNLN